MEGWSIINNYSAALANYERYGCEMVRADLPAYDLQILVRRSFGPVTSWNLYQRKTGDSKMAYAIRYVEWRKYTDTERVLNVMTQLKYVGKKMLPTIIRKEIDCPDEQLMAKLVRQFQGIQVPPYSDNSIKLDGTVCEVEINHRPENTGIRYSWWGSTPRQWKILEENVATAINTFREQSEKYGWVYVDK